MPSVYVLQCEQGKYYVGRTDQSVPQRFKQHLHGRGSAWTRKYKPLCVVEKKKNASKWDEDAYVKRWMKSKGIDNVRGGSYCQMKLDDVSMEALRREIRGAMDKCQKCGQKGHFARYCTTQRAKSTIKHCVRCNREGHTEARCYATTFANGLIKCPCCAMEINKCLGCSLEERNSCSSNNFKYKKKSSKCKRCGRNNHYTSNCYAETHANGYNLDNDDNGYGYEEVDDSDGWDGY